MVCASSGSRPNPSANAQTFCLSCCQFGHASWRCFGRPPKCTFCAGNHSWTLHQCKHADCGAPEGKFCSSHDKAKGVNCKGEHTAGSDACPVRPLLTHNQDTRNYNSRSPPLPVLMVIRLIQANCRKSPDCTTTILSKARNAGDVVLLQGFWTRPGDQEWDTVSDPNFWFFFFHRCSCTPSFLLE